MCAAITQGDDLVAKSGNYELLVQQRYTKRSCALWTALFKLLQRADGMPEVSKVSAVFD